MSSNRIHVEHCLSRLTALGIAYQDAVALRRIAMTLDRWHELECGDQWGRAVERDEATGKPFETWDSGDGKRHRMPVADRETGALTRLKKLMAKYPTLSVYIQGDPRGAPLYILRPGDVPEGCEADSYYSRGVAVYK